MLLFSFVVFVGSSTKDAFSFIHLLPKSYSTPFKRFVLLGLKFLGRTFNEFHELLKNRAFLIVLAESTCLNLLSEVSCVCCSQKFKQELNFCQVDSNMCMKLKNYAFDGI